MRHKSGLMWPLRSYLMKNISLCVDKCLHGAKEGDREGYRERVREREGKRERDGEWKRDPHNL